MGIEIFHFVFAIHYLYLLLLLFKQGIRYYLLYFVQLALAGAISIVAMVWGFTDPWLVIACGIVFTMLTIVPSILTRRILKDFPKHNLKKVVSYSGWRYFLTRARGHMVEHLIFQCWWLISQGKTQVVLDLLEKLPHDKYYQTWIDQLLVIAHGEAENWAQAVEIFENNGNNPASPFFTRALAKTVEGYCYGGQLDQAISHLGILEAHLDKTELKDLDRARVCVHAHFGNMEKVVQILDRCPCLNGDYWRGVTCFACGDFSSARRFFSHLQGIEEFKYGKTLKRKSAAMENDTATHISPASEEMQMYSLLDNWESFMPEVAKTKPPISRPVATWLLIALNLLYFLAMEMAGGAQNLRTALNFGTNCFDFVLYNGEYWRFVSAAFIHINYIHLLLNMLGLYFLGSQVEEYYGKRKLLVIYMLTAAISSFSSYYWNFGKVMMSMGSSGAICGLFGLNIYFFMFQARKIAPHIRKHYIFSFAYMIATLIAIGLIFPQIDNVAHFSGIIAGFIAGMLLAISPASRMGKAAFRLAGLSVSFALLLFLAWTGFELAQKLDSKSPQVPTLAWYSEQAKDASVKWGIPFSWRLLPQDKRSLSLSPESPLPISQSHIGFRDIYYCDGEILQNYFDRQKRLKTLKDGADKREEKTRLEHIDNLLTQLIVSFAPLEDWSGSLENLRDSEKIKIGILSFWYSQRKSDIVVDGEKIAMLEKFYYVKTKSRLCLFRFCFPKKHWPLYRNSVEKILSSVEIENNLR